MTNNFVREIPQKNNVMKQHYTHQEYEMFTDEQHISNFRDACNKRFATDWTNDNWYASAFYILSLPSIYGRTKRFITSEGIYFREIFKEEIFSSSENFLLRVAFNLFSDGKEHILIPKSILDRYAENIRDYLGINLSDMLLLDNQYYNVFLYALEIRKGLFK